MPRSRQFRAFAWRTAIAQGWLCSVTTYDVRGPMTTDFTKSDAEFKEWVPGYERENEAVIDQTSQPKLIRIPGVLGMVDDGKGTLFFAADGVEDLVIVRTAGSIQPVYLHTGVDASSLALSGNTLWIAGSGGATILDVSAGVSEDGVLQAKLLAPKSGGGYEVSPNKKACAGTSYPGVTDSGTGKDAIPAIVPDTLTFTPAPAAKNGKLPAKKEQQPASFTVTNKHSPFPQPITIALPAIAGIDPNQWKVRPSGGASCSLKAFSGSVENSCPFALTAPHGDNTKRKIGVKVALNSCQVAVVSLCAADDTKPACK